MYTMSTIQPKKNKIMSFAGKFMQLEIKGSKFKGSKPGPEEKRLYT
jgi:hypothetical protein